MEFHRSQENFDKYGALQRKILGYLIDFQSQCTSNYFSLKNESFELFSTNSKRKITVMNVGKLIELGLFAVEFENNLIVS